jgi:hypothetical protein
MFLGYSMEVSGTRWRFRGFDGGFRDSMQVSGVFDGGFRDLRLRFQGFDGGFGDSMGVAGSLWRFLGYSMEVSGVRWRFQGFDGGFTVSMEVAGI